MIKQPERIYKVVHHETGNVSWFSDSDEMWYVTDWYDDQKYSVYKYELVDEW